MKFLIAVIGMAMFLEGIPYFLFPNKTKDMLQAISQMETVTLRIIGFLIITLGLLITFFSRHF